MNRIKDIFGSQRNRIKDIFLNQRNRIVATGIMVFVWWCVFYPELCFPQDTYEVIYDTEDVGKIENDIENNKYDNNADTANIASAVIEENYPGILQADDEQIVIGSRLLEWLGKKKN